MKNKNSIMTKDLEEFLDIARFTVDSKERLHLFLNVTLSAETKDSPVETVNCADHGDKEEPEV